MTEFKNASNKSFLQYTNDPLQNFLYALKAPDSKRQYPRRFEYFLDYLGLQGSLKEKSFIFYEQAKNEPLWTQHQIMQYIEFQKERVEKGEIIHHMENHIINQIIQHIHHMVKKITTIMTTTTNLLKIVVGI